MVSFHLESATWQVVGQALTVSDYKHTAENKMIFAYFLQKCQRKKIKKSTNINN